MNNTDIYKAFAEIDDDILERSEKAAAHKIIPLRRRLVMAVAAVLVVVVLMGAAAIRYSDSIQNWLEYRWKSVTDAEMSSEQATLADELSQYIGLSQTADGVTVTVDSAVVFEDYCEVLILVTGENVTEELISKIAHTVKIQLAANVELTGWAVTCGNEEDGSVINVHFSYSKNAVNKPVDVCLTLSDNVYAEDDITNIGDEKWKFNFSIYPKAENGIKLDDIQTTFPYISVNENGEITEQGYITVDITDIEFNSSGLEFSYQQTDDMSEKRLQILESITVCFINGDEYNLVGGSIITSLEDGQIFADVSCRWLVPIDIESISEIHIGDTVIPVK